jgi:L-serine kinase (ADP)
MKGLPVFRLVPLADLKEHEEIDPADARSLAERILASGVVEDPIWVADGSGVILNGHHRVAALKSLGARRAPAWLIEYDADWVRLERWQEGPPIPKSEVVRRAATGQLFQPKTTRHILGVELPPRPTPLSELLEPEPAGAAHAAHRRASGRSRPSAARASDSG